MNKGPVMNRIITNVPKENVQSLIHLFLSKPEEIIEKIRQSISIVNKTKSINLKKPGKEGLLLPSKIIKYRRIPLANETKINVVISFFIFLFL